MIQIQQHSTSSRRIDGASDRETISKTFRDNFMLMAMQVSMNFIDVATSTKLPVSLLSVEGFLTSMLRQVPALPMKHWSASRRFTE